MCLDVKITVWGSVAGENVCLSLLRDKRHFLQVMNRCENGHNTHRLLEQRDHPDEEYSVAEVA